MDNKKIGFALGDYITTEKIKRKGNYYKDNKPRGIRTYLVFLSLIIIVLLIFSRLVYLQVIQGSYYRNLADSNRLNSVKINAPRGIIFDRNSKPLVFNVPGYRQEIDGKTKFISEEEAIELLGKGVELEIDSLREYPLGIKGAHLLGYLGQISEVELKNETYKEYFSGEVIGKMGIEQQYEKLLKGIDGKRLVEIDSNGKIIRKLGESDPIPGNNIKLTIDSALQEAAFSALEEVERGAIVVSTPKGEILALISKPSFDPNLFTKGSTYKTSSTSAYLSVDDILTDDKGQPLLNRAITGTYPPGSTFKIITAASGLENEIIDTNYRVEDTGILRIGSFSFANWFFTNYGKTDGEVNVVKGLKRSNDIFFYKLAEKIGVEKLAKMAKNFYIDKSLGIDLSGEAKGTVPDNEWKLKNIGEPWYLGDIYNTGIGQGYLLATPLQVNSWAQVIAAEGALYRPYIFKNLGDKAIDQNLLSKKSIEPIRKGMIESCQPGGVAFPLFNFRVTNDRLKIDGKNILKSPESTTSAKARDERIISVACKTGTSEQGGETSLPHAWITLFAPAYDPEIVVTVLAEESGEGSNIAAPIAKEILEEWFSKK